MTFDDGPDSVWTPRVLDRLGREGARATFFVMADRALRYPGLIERMRAEGHQVEFHCLRHVRHSELEEPALRQDTGVGLWALARVSVNAQYWRPPWGVVTAATARVAAIFGLEVVRWDVDSEDWRGDNAAEMHARVVAGVRAGAVVLMHDGLGPGAGRSGARHTVELISRLQATMRERGLLSVTLSEMLR